MTENLELRTKILEWQKTYNISDGDPAMAIVDLLDIYHSGRPVLVGESVTSVGQHVPASAVSATLDEAALEQLRMHLMPAIERLSFQTQELKQRLDEMSLDTFAQQVASYHEGIDYCTKKLDVIKKENDAIGVKITKTAESITPVTRMAVIVLVGVAGVIGFVVAVALR